MPARHFTPGSQNTNCTIPLCLALSLGLFAVSTIPAMAANPSDSSTIGLTGEPIEETSQDEGTKAGFDFSKLDADGNTLPAEAHSWSCVKDNATGLIWEVKTDDNGLHDKDWTYSWYNTASSSDAATPGTASAGSCGGTVAAGCDTEKFVAAVNATGLCGGSNWRLPSSKELLTIVDKRHFNPAIDTTYFPQTLGTYFWSSTSHTGFANRASCISFANGKAFHSFKHPGYAVRLVRTAQ